MPPFNWLAPLTDIACTPVTAPFKVAVPLLLITAQDDPFVPYVSFLAARVEENPRVRLVAMEHGGHCGFVSRFAGDERFWAEERIVEFVEEAAG